MKTLIYKMGAEADPHRGCDTGSDTVERMRNGRPKSFTNCAHIPPLLWQTTPRTCVYKALLSASKGRTCAGLCGPHVSTTLLNKLPAQTAQTCTDMQWPLHTQLHNLQRTRTSEQAITQLHQLQVHSQTSLHNSNTASHLKIQMHLAHYTTPKSNGQTSNPPPLCNTATALNTLPSLSNLASNCSWLKLHCQPVHAVTQASGWWSIIKHMANVTATRLAPYFCPGHENDGIVRRLCYSTCRCNTQQTF